MITVAGYIAKFLKEKGVKHIFGFQGSAMLKMLDEIVAEKIEYVQGFNEQASGFAADAYARVSGELGAAIATSGPGAVNLIGGIANAFFDSVPVMFITGQDYSNAILANNGARQNGFQDMDIVSMVKPVTKYAVLLDKPENIRYELEKAYYFATSERKGSVLIDVPIDVQFKEVDENLLKGFTPPSKPKYDLKINKVIKMIQEAKRPIILAGGGVRGANATNEFRKFLEKTNIPVAAALNGIDVCENIIGFSGLYGNSQANLSLLNADLIISIGARFSFKQIGRKKEEYSNAKVIQVEIDNTEINRTFMKADLNIKADLKEFLTEINKYDFQLDIKNWTGIVSEWCKKYQSRINCNKKGINPIELVQQVAPYLSNDAVVTADVGANQMWVAQAIRLKGNQRLLNSAGFGAMGYSLPASIGASYLAPAVAFTGDGGFQMNLQELNTLSIRQNNVKCFVFNNNNLGLMRDTQKRYYHNHFYGNNEKEFTCPNIKKLADTFLLNYLKIEKINDYKKLKKVFDNDKPCLIDVIIDKDATVFNKYDDIGTILKEHF